MGRKQKEIKILNEWRRKVRVVGKDNLLKGREERRRYEEEWGRKKEVDK